MKKILLASLLLYLLAPTTIEAKKRLLGNGLYWELCDDGVLIISGKGDMPDFNYFSSGKKVKAPWYKFGKNIRKIIIEEGIISIGESSFDTSVTDGMHIDDDFNVTFENRYIHIEQITLPKSLKVIKSRAFCNLDGLKSINIEEGVRSIGSYAFCDCSALSFISLPSSLIELGEGCFWNCKNLSVVILPSNLKKLGDLSFADCNINELSLPDGLEIGQNAFSRNNIKLLKIPTNCTFVKDGHFGCSNSFVDRITLHGKYSIENHHIADINPIITCLPSCVNTHNANKYGLSVHSVQNYINSIKDKSGNVIVAYKEDQKISPFAVCGTINYYSVQNKNTFGIVDETGKWIIPLDKNYSNLHIVGDKYIKVANNALYGIITFGGDEIIPTSRGYTSIEYNSSKGTFAFKKPRYTGECDAQGNEISLTKLPPTANDIKDEGGYASAVEMMNGSINYYKVSKGGKYGLTSSEGKVIVPVEMEALESAGTGYLRFKVGSFWGVMNYAGKILIPTERGYTKIGDYVSFTKRFPYEMAGYKGECNNLGVQVSKIKVNTPKQNMASNPSNPDSNSKSNIIYEYEYSYDASSDIHTCLMEKAESFIFGKKAALEYFQRSFRIVVFGNEDCFINLGLYDMGDGNPIASLGNKAITFPEDEIKGCSLTISLSNGENIQMRNCDIYDNRKGAFKGNPDFGSIGIILGLANTTSTGRTFSNDKERHDYIIEQCRKYDIRTITYDGQTLDMNEVQTAPTINAMVNKIRSMTDSSK